MAKFAAYSKIFQIQRSTFLLSLAKILTIIHHIPKWWPVNILLFACFALSTSIKHKRIVDKIWQRGLTNTHKRIMYWPPFWNKVYNYYYKQSKPPKRKRKCRCLFMWSSWKFKPNFCFKMKCIAQSTYLQSCRQKLTVSVPRTKIMTKNLDMLSHKKVPIAQHWLFDIIDMTHKTDLHLTVQTSRHKVFWLPLSA